MVTAVVSYNLLTVYENYLSNQRLLCDKVFSHIFTLVYAQHGKAKIHSWAEFES